MVTTPIEITNEISAFCKEIDSTTSPIFLEYFPVERYICGDCYGNVDKHIEKNGGRTQYGWIIWEDPKTFLEAEFHVVWANDKEEYFDVTPKKDGEKRILFLPDSQKRFTGELVDNIRKALIDTPETRALVKVSQKRFEIYKKYYTGNPEIKIPLLEMVALDEYYKLMLKEERLKDSVNKQRIGRNEPCPCKSGKKYKKCCGDS